MFTVEERDHVRARLLEMAHEDSRIVAGAEIGALARGGDRWSDLDLTFGVADSVDVEAVIGDWTSAVEEQLAGVHLFDLPFRTSIYRVFLLPGNLQVDLSFTPQRDFGARGPEFALLFGEAADQEPAPEPSAQHLFGMGVHHAVRARICIERGRLWQAEYWTSALRDYGLSLAALRRGLVASYGRGFDELPRETLAAAREALPRSVDGDELLRALGAAVELLLQESGDVGATASRLAGPLRELTERLDDAASAPLPSTASATRKEE